LRNNKQEWLLGEADQIFTIIAKSIWILVNKITLQKRTVHFEVNHSLIRLEKYLRQII
jgi:hypothetical protein